jgi:hypothetical protein
MEWDQEEYLMKYTKVNYNELQNSILAVTNAKKCLFLVLVIYSEDDLATADILGFAFITSVDNTKRQITLNIPNGGDLPSYYMFKTNIMWKNN